MGSGSVMLSFDIRHTSQAAAEAALVASCPAAKDGVHGASAEQAAVAAGMAEAASRDTALAVSSVAPAPAALSMSEAEVGGRTADALSAHSSARHLGGSRLSAPLSHNSELLTAAGGTGLSQAAGHIAEAETPDALPTGPAARGAVAEPADAVTANASAGIRAPDNDLGLTPEDYEAVTFDF
jgi:hypothetical protein